jgi:lysyl-tRNA synthetase class I
MIAKTARAFNLTRNIEPAQIVDLVTDLEQDFYFLKLSEVFYVLKQARMGKMGKLYERLDQPTIIGWFSDYVEKRMEISEEESLRQHDQYTYMEKDRSYDKFITNLQEQQEKTEQKRISNLAYEMAKKMNINNNG